MTDTVTAPTTDRKLLADVHRWARTNGWTRAGWRGWQNARYEDQATVAARVNEAGFQVWRKLADASHFTGQPTEYPADSIRQAVDLLVALGILPARFSSACGVEAVIADREAQASSTEVAAAVAFTLEMELRPWFGPRSVPEEHLRRIAARLMGSAQWVLPAAPGCDCSATGGQGLVPTVSREHADDCPAVAR